MRVFKYRGGPRDIQRRDVRTLAKNQIFAAPVESLNDPFEAQVQFHGESLRIGQFLSIVAGSCYTDAMRSAEDRFIAEIDAFAKKAKTFGVYSLSKNATDELLWAYYADAHRGFCIEYELDLLLAYKLAGEGIVHVAYRADIPVISASDIARIDTNHDDLWQKFIGTKSKRWEHEQEVRLVTGQTGLFEYDYRALKAVYFGYRCDPSLQRLIMRVLAGRGILYYQVRPVDGTYQLKAFPTPDRYGRAITYRARVAPVADGAPHFDAKLECYRDLVLKAIEIVRRDPYCEEILHAYLSSSKGTPDNPVFYVTYKRSDGLPQNYFLRKAEIEAHEGI